jgi:hypothetical protein
MVYVCWELHDIHRSDCARADVLYVTTPFKRSKCETACDWLQAHERTDIRHSFQFRGWGHRVVAKLNLPARHVYMTVGRLWCLSSSPFDMRSNGPSPGPDLSLGSSYVPLVLHDGIYRYES